MTLVCSVVGVARLGFGRAAFGAFMFLGALGCSTGAAHAQTIDRLQLVVERWGGWENLGGLGVSRPDCLSVQVNRIDCFTANSGGALARKGWNGQAWAGPTVFGGLPMAPGAGPDCVAWAVDHIDCFARRGSDNAPFRRTFHGAFVSGWEALGGALSSDPECVATRAERLECFGRGMDGVLYRNSFNGDIWSTWSPTPGQVYNNAKPACVAFQGEAHCMFATFVTVSPGVTAIRLKHFHFPAGGGVIQRDMQGGDIADIGPDFAPGPRCFVASQIHCFAVRFSATEGNVMGWWTFNGSGNWAISNLGPEVRGAWDCVVRSEDRIDCMELRPAPPSPNGVSPGMVMLHRVFERGAGLRIAEANLAPLMSAKTIRCVAWSGDRIDCFTGGHGADAAPLHHSWLTLEHPIENVRRFPGR
jgi:hypothetical protein